LIDWPGKEKNHFKNKKSAQSLKRKISVPYEMEVLWDNNFRMIKMIAKDVYLPLWHPIY
jgi:hypothetical protein